MSYPYGQPGNPSSGGSFHHGFPPQGTPQPGTRVPKPSGGTAIAAGVLALIQGIAVFCYALAGAIGTWTDRRNGDSLTGDYIALILVGTLAGLLLAGAILLLIKQRIGRILVIAMPIIVLLAALGGVAYSLITDPSDVASNVSFFVVVLTFAFTLELTTMCLALTSSAGRWVASRTTGAGVADGYAPQPQYPY
ncbi:hypothetical protein KO481_01540 [Nocardia sp. NEAU-G5]|uniref:Uncharacterized protein n=1 Tax=Nocardia albiluteola TaxID=2842303 RepID=A0ABS6ARJ0_9NOCA|nr:hypothetical protein [Nocardia albiluteola]MBU3060210.1 hypothetical protein [Nocardia albiluteola]